MEAAGKGVAVYCPMEPESIFTFSRSIRPNGIGPAFGLQFYFSRCRVNTCDIPEKVRVVSLIRRLDS